MFRLANPLLTVPVLSLSLWMLEASFMAYPSKTIGQEIGFIESYALATDRDAQIAKLIPGTEDFFYYSCLHYQTSGKLAESQSIIDSWIAKYGMSENARRMQMRQVLLSYNSASPQVTLEYLKQNLGLNVFHDRPNPNEASQLPTKLDPQTIDWQTLLRAAVTTNSRLDQIEDILLAEALSKIEYEPDFVAWIGRLQRPDLPGTVETIARELRQQDSRGFGWATIHTLLSTEQLDQLLKLVPTLIESDSFVQTRMRRIRPNDDVALADPKALRAHLEELQAFAMKLPDSQASLKAHILFQRLQLDASEDVWDRERFMQYLALPRQSMTINREYLQRSQNHTVATLNADYSLITTLPPINDDSELIQTYLEHFFQKDATPDAFSNYLDRSYLKRIFASTKILYGIGDSKTFYSQLSPEDQRALRDKIEMRFSKSNRKYWSLEDSVKLSLSIKNVPRLTIKVYRIQSRNLLSAQQKNVSTDLDLDGLVANAERVLEFAQPADCRHLETLDFPEMEGRGVWVVDLFGGGQRGRVLIQKGQLRSLRSLSDAGHLFRIVDEKGKFVPTAKVLLGEREFSVTGKEGDDGAILVPFAETKQTRPVLLVDGNFASLESFEHLNESYTLQGGFVVDPQSLLSGSKAALVLRTQLLCNDSPVSIKGLEKAQVTIRATDLDGIETTQTFSNLELSDTLENVVHFLVPQRLRTLVFTFSGRILNLSTGSYQDLSTSHTTNVNSLASTSQIADFYLTRLAGGYAIEVLGRNGESLSQLPVSIDIKLRGLQNRVTARLATDAKGRIELGELSHVESFSVTANGITTRNFELDASFLNWPTVIHGVSGKPLALAWPETESALRNYPQRLSLIEYRSGIVATIKNESITVQSGRIDIKPLTAGTYKLTDHLTNNVVELRVVDSDRDGADAGDFLVSPTRSLEKDPYVPVHISSTIVANSKLTIQVGSADSATRVHVIAMPFDQSPAVLASLPSIPATPSSIRTSPTPSFYLDSMKLDEEYQYVLARQLAKKFVGNMLPQPSVILNPWELSVTNNEAQVAALGDAMAAMSAPAPAAMMLREKAERFSGKMSGSNEAIYEFLSRGTLLVANLRPDEKGVIEIDSELLADNPNVVVLVVHPTGTTYRRVAMPTVKPRTTTDQSLKKAYEETVHLAERQVVRILREGKENIDLGEATSSRVKLFSTWAEAYGLLSTLRKGDAELEKFRVLTTWATLDDAAKNAQYALLASHELNLFLATHDTDYFNRCIKPTLSDKYAKQLVDDVLLEGELANYTTPARLGILNAAERALLGKKFPPQFGPNVRWLSDSVRVAIDSEDPRARYARFDTALLGGILDSTNEASMAFGSMQPAEFFGMAASGPEGAMGGGGLGATDKAEADFSDRSLAMDGNGRGSRLRQNAAKPGMARAGRARLEEGENLESSKGQFDSGLFRSRRDAKDAARLYQSLEKTRKWAESQFFRVPLPNQNAELIKPSKYWLDFLQHPKDESKFLSTHLTEAGQSTTDALMALAVLQLPLESKGMELAVEKGRIIVKNPTNSLAYIQKIESIEPAKDATPLLIGQDIYLAQPSDSGIPKPITSKSLLINVAYRASVVITNPTASVQRVQVLTQVPQGAIALSNGKQVRSTPVDIAPYSSHQIAYEFYFPKPGTFQHYAAQVSNLDGFLAASTSKTWNVLAVPDEVDETTWNYVAAWGTEPQVTKYLETANLKQIDLSAIAWRMKSKQFFEATLKQLDSLGCFDSTLWSYAVIHNDKTRIRELVESMPQVVESVGPYLNSQLFVSQPVERLQFEHYDFRPLVVARIHPLGNKKVILNDQLAAHYNTFMKMLAYQKAISPEQSLALVYYLLVQNRIEEALARFDSIPHDNLSLDIQYDYFAAYMDFYRGEYGKAEQIANNYLDHPHLKWQSWFSQLLSHVQERKALQSGERVETVTNEDWKKDSQQRIVTGERNASQSAAAAKLPSLEILEEGGQYKIRHKNIAEFDIHYYLMDIELLFTRKPFVQNNDGRLNIIAPNKTEKLKIAEGTEVINLSIPQELRNRNLVVEIQGGGLVRSTVVYNNALVTTLSTTMGQLQVTSQKDRQPLELTYVKVYAQHQDGSVRFYKDGYTDLRGKFDYASVSTSDADTAVKFSILILHPEHGAAIRETQAPRATP